MYWGGATQPMELVEHAYAELARRAAASIADVPVTTYLARGNAAGAILEHVEKHSCDLIVMGTRGRSRALAALFRSTSQAVTRRARVPVVAVRLDSGGQHSAARVRWSPRQRPERAAIAVVTASSTVRSAASAATRLAGERRAPSESARTITPLSGQHELLLMAAAWLVYFGIRAISEGARERRAGARPWRVAARASAQHRVGAPRFSNQVLDAITGSWTLRTGCTYGGTGRC